MSEITVLPMGGLGNQLFIYGLGRSLAGLSACPLTIDTTFLGSSSSQLSANVSVRRYHLNDFTKPTFVKEEALGTQLKRHPRIGRFGISWVLRPHTIKGRPTPVMEDASQKFDSRIMSLRSGSFPFGYFQSWKYLEPVADDLRQEIQSIRNPSSWFVAQQKFMKESRRAIGIHVRRGDYPDPIDSRYYSRAVELALDLQPHAEIYIFSDDLPRAIAELNSLHRRLVPVIPDRDASDLESLLLLSKCDAIITANSTFSWWAGWLAERPEAVVIAPRPWHFRSTTTDADLIPPNWITIGR
jgi:hypothetical protein